MSALVRGMAVIGLLVLPAVASANGLRLRSQSQQTTYYYYPTTTSYYYVPTYSMAECLPNAAPTFMPRATTTLEPPGASGLPRKVAQPVPAGPSGDLPAGPKTTEPPRGAGVSEARSYFSAYAVAPRGAPVPAGERARVAFWNLSSTDITLTVANEAYSLPRGKNLKLDLPRQFVWRVDSREAQNEKCPQRVGRSKSSFGDRTSLRLFFDGLARSRFIRKTAAQAGTASMGHPPPARTRAYGKSRPLLRPWHARAGVSDRRFRQPELCAGSHP